MGGLVVVWGWGVSGVVRVGGESALAMPAVFCVDVSFLRYLGLVIRVRRTDWCVRGGPDKN